MTGQRWNDPIRLRNGVFQAEPAVPARLTGRARLRLLDAIGRVAATLADNNHAAGWHAARLDAARLPTGVYVLRLETGTTTLTRKLVIER